MLEPEGNGAVAYLTSQYPATSHTFIRREVSALRALEVEIQTFSIRAPSRAELVANSDRDEAARTFTLLSQPLSSYAVAHAKEVLTRPGAYVSTLLAAWRHRAPGMKNALLAMAHFGEAILLAGELRRRAVRHLHNHFANSAATVGFLAARHLQLPWSFTIHGISEFDYPAGNVLPEKIRAAAFVACVSYFGRAQAARLVEPEHWPKLNIVRCGLELDKLPVAGPRTHDRTRVISTLR